MADPWVKFYTGDWRSDPALKICSLAARGLWIEMICLMHEAHPYGHLLVNGLSPTETQLGLLVGAPPEQIAASLGELESAGVFSRTRAGVIYSRKLTRMAKKAATARNNGRLGGNPSLGKATENPALDKGVVNGGDKTQIPEARDQRKEREAKASPKKGSRLSPEWALPRAWGEWALGEGLSAAGARREADRFRDYWLGRTGKDAAKLDWEATWRNWVRKALDDLAKQTPRQRYAEPRQGDERRTPDGRRQVFIGTGWVSEG
jgi:hypothetical protein